MTVPKCPRCFREIEPDDLHTGVCWSCGFMVDMDAVIEDTYTGELS